ncbi:MAG TPA: nitroreductase [Thermoanaerobaculia bacterium]|nr:nitroreductase [Thermoanaerobaculia bacterium]
MSSSWYIDEADFHEIESHEGRMKFLLRYAVLAPSTHNTQPWSFRITPDGIEVFADFSRRLMTLDPGDRELMLSVGAAVTNFRVAAAHFGYDTMVLYRSAPAETGPVALVTVRMTCLPDASLQRLFPAIRRRRTSRKAFKPEPIDPDAMQKLCELVDASSGMLRLILPRDRRTIADFVEQADRQQMRRAAVRAEIADWIRTRRARDGIPAAGILPRVIAPLGPWLLRNLDISRWRARRDREVVESAGALLLVCAEDDRVPLLQAGELLERVLLTVTQSGLQYGFLNQAIEVEELREKVRTLSGSTFPPQLIVAIGIGAPQPKRTPRRNVEAVLAKG